MKLTDSQEREKERAQLNMLNDPQFKDYIQSCVDDCSDLDPLILLAGAGVGCSYGFKAGVASERARSEILLKTMRSISINGCCDTCQQAKLFALEALRDWEGTKGE